MTAPASPPVAVGVELAACPFCGSPPEVKTWGTGKAARVGIRCADVDCPGSMRLPSPDEDAREFWNRRAVPMEAETSMAVARLSDLLRADHLTGDYPIAGMGPVSWDDLRAIRQILALIPQAEETVK